MKKILISTSVIATIFAITGCEKFLTKEPLAQETSIGYYDTKANAEKAVNAIYDPLGWERFFYGVLFAQGDCGSPDAEVGGNLGVNDQPDAQDIMLYKTLASNSLTETFARTCYVGIQRANNLLKYTSDVNYNANQYRGEAFFLRSLYYYYLVNVFGPVPLITDPVSSDEYTTGNRQSGDDEKGTKQVEAIYSQIIQDLDSAVNVLPTRSQYSSSQKGRATKESALGYLIKTYANIASNKNLFTKEDKSLYWNKIITYSNQIKDAGYDLEPDYHNIFTLAGENGIESLFEIQYIKGIDYGNKDEGTIRTLDFTPRSVFGYPTSPYGYGMLNPTIDLVSQFDIMKSDNSIIHFNWVLEPAIPADVVDKTAYLLNYMKKNSPNLKDKSTYKAYDPRLDMIAKPGDSLFDKATQKWYYIKALKGTCVGNLSATGFWLLKTQSEFKDGDQSNGLNQILLRYADILLIQAEAEMAIGNTSEAVKLVNKVRERARNSALDVNGNKTTSIIPEDLTEANFTIENIYQERRLELFGEGIRFYDLVRWNKANTACANRKEFRGRSFAWNNEKSYVLPIPTRLISDGEGNVIQNPGY